MTWHIGSIELHPYELIQEDFYQLLNSVNIMALTLARVAGFTPVQHVQRDGMSSPSFHGESQGHSES